MDKFVKEAFEKADKAVIEKASKKFQEVMDKDRFLITLTCCVNTGVKDMAMLIKAVKDAGLEHVLKEYESWLLAGGFKHGYIAGRESMLEDHV